MIVVCKRVGLLKICSFDNLNLVPVNLERYEYKIKPTYKEYFFFSEGPGGRIRKVVLFVLFNNTPPSYNLILGDWNNNDKCIDHRVVTNNRDTEKVLATVWAIIMEFTNIFGDVVINIEGNTDARKRLYQMSMNKFFHEIGKKFHVYGVIGNEYEAFQKNVHYEALLITRIESQILEEPTEIYMTKKSKEISYVYYDQTVDGPELVDIDNDPVVLQKMEATRKRWESAAFPSREALLRLSGKPKNSRQ